MIMAILHCDLYTTPEIAVEMDENRSRVFYLVHMIVQSMILTMWINELDSNMVDTISLPTNDVSR